MNVFFVIDEYTDLANGIDTRRLADIVMDALRNPHKERPPREWIGGRIVQESVNLAEVPPCTNPCVIGSYSIAMRYVI